MRLRGCSEGMRWWPVAGVLVLAVATHAQTSRGTVAGTVLDPSGAVVAGANVTLTGVDTGVRLSAPSNEAGVYRLDAVDLGVYDLSIEHPGFKTYQATRFGVEANRVTTIDPVLELGATGSRVEVNGESSEPLTKDSPLRGGNFQPREVRDLPLISLNPLSLARTLPGATEAAGSTIWGGGYTTANANGGAFSINGQRTRGNNYLLDGIDNNEIWLSGEEQVFTIADAVEEVSVQTGNFGVEFGRAGGGVFNVVTKSGTNSLHGTLLWRYQSQRFDSISNLNRLNNIPQSVFSHNIFGFTAGGPIRKNKTFFFVGFQQDNTHSTGNYPVKVPTAGAVTQLETLFPNNPRLELYLGLLGTLRGTGSPFSVQLGIDPQTGVNRESVQFATAAYVLPSINDGPQWLARIDHIQSERHRLSWRYTYDSRITLPQNQSSPPFPGFVQEDAFRHQNFLFADSYTFSPSYTNEFRFAYTRPDVNLYTTWPGSAPQASTLPQITIANVSAPGLLSANSQFHYGNDFQFQETQTKLIGRHALRYGVEFLQQLITQQRGANDLGSISYTNWYSAFANFLDDFSGCASRKLDPRALGYSTGRFSDSAHPASGAESSSDVQQADFPRAKRCCHSSRDSGSIWATSEQRPLDESAAEECVTVTPLDIPPRFRRRDVRTDDAVRQPVAPLPHAPTPAPALTDSPACPSPATNECECRDNTPGTISNADPMTLS